MKTQLHLFVIVYYYYYYYYYSFSRHTPINSLSLPLNSHLASLCLVSLHAVTDGTLQCVFLHPLFSPVTFIISKFIQTSIYI